MAYVNLDINEETANMIQNGNKVGFEPQMNRSRR